MNWRPIETAPKDGTWILTFDPEEPDKWSKYGIYKWSTFFKEWVDQRDVTCADFTHWMPLPPPPETE